jgi:uncharacterized protein (TIGR02271 family)
MSGRGKSGGGGGEGRPQPGPADDSVVLHEEEATVGKRWEGVGRLRVRREVDRETVRGEFPLRRQDLAQERIPTEPDDPGEIETLPDGSISIPLFEEELVVTRRVVLRERVIIRKEDVTEWETVDAELRRERVTFETDELD